MSGPGAGPSFGTPSLTRRRFSVRTLGCKVNHVESEQIAAELLARGFEWSAEEAADVVIVNTCTVTAEADSKARSAIRHALALAGAPLVVVTGCLAAVSNADIEGLGAGLVVESDVAKVAERIAPMAGVPAVECSNSGTRGQRFVRTGDRFHTRAMVKVQDGCDAFCTYCIVPYARGVPQSVALDEVVAECGALVEAGVLEIVLTGINLGRYEQPGARLPDLVSQVAATGVTRLRLSSIEPLDLTERLLETLASTPAVCEHLHVPLQSGSDAVLGQMGRMYTAAQYAERTSEARSALPGVEISTDVLAGFPGETEAQAHDTFEFCREIGFSRLHVFRYSPRHGTPAAARADRIDAAQTGERARALRALDRELRAAHAHRARSAIRDVLVDKVGSDESRGCGFVEGVTGDYLRVRVPTEPGAEPIVVGALVPARIGGIGDDGIVEGVLQEGTNADIGDPSR